MVSKKDVEYIASLARIKLNKKEKDKLLKDLSSILDYVEKLKEVDTTNIEPMVQVTGTLNKLREDKKPKVLSGDELEKLISQTPKRKDGYIEVRAVFK